MRSAHLTVPLLCAGLVVAAGLPAAARTETAPTRTETTSARTETAPVQPVTAYRPTAAVSLGDSYISGVAGRWLGNAATAAPGLLGTDRAWRATPGDPAGVVDRSLVYGDTVAQECYRSDVAEITSARLPVQRAINLACSGATTANVLRAAAGGVAFKGEDTQNDQLARVARQNQVKLIVLSIGGNDLKFSSIVDACVSAYLFTTPPCSTSVQAAVENGLPAMGTAVSAVLTDIHATMASAGYSRRDYRLILQSYPSALPAAGENRYSGTAPDARATVGGCPLLDQDAAWTNSSLVPDLSSTLAAAARRSGAQFLDLTDALRGHELCASAATQVTANAGNGYGGTGGATGEWVRMVDLAGQGDSLESLHPNTLGQKAMGRCLALAVAAARNVACHGVPGASPGAVHVGPIG